MDQLDEPLGKVATTDTFITHDEYVIMPSTFCGISDDLGIFMLYLQDPPHLQWIDLREFSLQDGVSFSYASQIRFP